MNQQTIGQRLSGARESIRASLYQASKDTKIRLDFLECMESDNFSFVSGGPYVRGMLRSYARWLGLDETTVMRDFDASYGGAAQSPVSAMVSTPVHLGPKQRRPHWLLAASGAAGILLLLSLVGLMDRGGNVAKPPPNPVEPQAQAGAGGFTVSPSIVAQAPAVPTQGVNVQVDVIGARAWLRVLVDANEQTPYFEGILAGGQSRVFSARDRVKLLIGDLGAVKLSLNGKDLGTPGRPGEVATREFTAEPVRPPNG